MPYFAIITFNTYSKKFTNTLERSRKGDYPNYTKVKVIGFGVTVGKPADPSEVLSETTLYYYNKENCQRKMTRAGVDFFNKYKTACAGVPGGNRIK